MPALPSFLVLTFFITSGLCAVYQQLGDLKQHQFDFVVVGGGTAGAVLASRLSEVKNFQVLVIEAGHSNEGVLDSQVPLFAPNLQSSPHDWNSTTTPQKFANGRMVHYARGYLLGGTSSINLMAYTRGSSDDYDRWARVTGDQGWSWNQVLPYFKKNERLLQPRDGRNITGEFDPNVHGFEGMVHTSLPNELQQPFDKQVMAAIDELGGIFKYNTDMNSGNPLGTSWVQGTNGGGERSSSATAYLTPDVVTRNNLHVLLNTKAIRVQGSNTSSSDFPMFDKIQVVGNDKNTVIIQATKEVILSAGCIGSPQILFHSGIGDAKEMQSLGIKPLVNLPSLGKNFTDHPFILVDFAATQNGTGVNVLSDEKLLAGALDEWKKSKTGPLSNILTNHIIWGRLPENSSFADPSSGPVSPHWELLMSVNIGPSPMPHITAAIDIVSPASRGTLTFNSSDPLDPPLIDPAYFSSDVDRAVARDAIKNSRKFLNAKAFEGTIISEAPPSAGAESDDELDAFVGSVFTTTWHGGSSAKMSPKGADYGVVDPDLKVKGVRGLRVVDASVMPYIVSAHTMGATYVIAERASDMIKQEWAS